MKLIEVVEPRSVWDRQEYLVTERFEAKIWHPPHSIVHRMPRGHFVDTIEVERGVVVVVRNVSDSGIMSFGIRGEDFDGSVYEVHRDKFSKHVCEFKDKEPVIKTILWLMANGDGEDYEIDHIEDLVKRAKAAGGTNWPELKTIEKSINAKK